MLTDVFHGPNGPFLLNGDGYKVYLPANQSPTFTQNGEYLYVLDNQNVTIPIGYAAKAQSNENIELARKLYPANELPPVQNNQIAPQQQQGQQASLYYLNQNNQAVPFPVDPQGNPLPPGYRDQYGNIAPNGPVVACDQWGNRINQPATNQYPTYKEPGGIATSTAGSKKLVLNASSTFGPSPVTAVSGQQPVEATQPVVTEPVKQSGVRIIETHLREPGPYGTPLSEEDAKTLEGIINGYKLIYEDESQPPADRQLAMDERQKLRAPSTSYIRPPENDPRIKVGSPYDQARWERYEVLMEQARKEDTDPEYYIKREPLNMPHHQPNAYGNPAVSSHDRYVEDVEMVSPYADVVEDFEEDALHITAKQAEINEHNKRYDDLPFDQHPIWTNDKIWDSGINLFDEETGDEIAYDDLVEMAEKSTAAHNVCIVPKDEPEESVVEENPRRSSTIMAEIAIITCIMESKPVSSYTELSDMLTGEEPLYKAFKYSKPNEFLQELRKAMKREKHLVENSQSDKEFRYASNAYMGLTEIYLHLRDPADFNEPLNEVAQENPTDLETIMENTPVSAYGRYLITEEHELDLARVLAPAICDEMLSDEGMSPTKLATSLRHMRQQCEMDRDSNEPTLLYQLNEFDRVVTGYVNMQLRLFMKNDVEITLDSFLDECTDLVKAYQSDEMLDVKDIQLILAHLKQWLTFSLKEVSPTEDEDADEEGSDKDPHLEVSMEYKTTLHMVVVNQYADKLGLGDLKARYSEGHEVRRVTVNSHPAVAGVLNGSMEKGKAKTIVLKLLDLELVCILDCEATWKVSSSADYINLLC